MEKENMLIVHKTSDYEGYWGTSNNLDKFQPYIFDDSDFFDELLENLVDIGVVKAENIKVFEGSEIYKYIKID